MKAENDYKKQIRELQSALAIQRHKNNAMAKGLIPREFLEQYARIQIEKDRERVIHEFNKDHSLRKVDDVINQTPIILD